MRALWQPRLIEAIDWIAEEVAQTPRTAAARLRPKPRASAA